MITNEKHLLYILKVKKGRLEYILEHLDNFYYSFSKPKINHITGRISRKANGEEVHRLINAPNEELKRIQKRIYKFIRAKVDLPSYIYGGVKGKNNIRNARFHQGNKYIFTTDLKSFFPSITYKQVFHMFLREGCTPSVARILTKLTTLHYSLPQGTPTSSLIANLVFKPYGEQIAEFASRNDMKFSMFVDDITISSKTDFKNLVPEILNIINRSGYRISHKKTHYQTKNPVITGVVCHNGKLLAPSVYKKKLARLRKEQEEKSEPSNHLRGLENYIHSIEMA
jgi:RNA-directed DNA polymerase